MFWALLWQWKVGSSSCLTRQTCYIPCRISCTHTRKTHTTNHMYTWHTNRKSEAAQCKHKHTHMRVLIPAHLICPSSVDWHSPLEEIKCAHAVSAQLDVHLSSKLIRSVSVRSMPATCTRSVHVPQFHQAHLLLHHRCRHWREQKLAVCGYAFFCTWIGCLRGHLCAGLISGQLHCEAVWKLPHRGLLVTAILCFLKHFVGMCFSSNISCVLFNCHTERRSLWCLWIQQQQI